MDKTKIEWLTSGARYIWNGWNIIFRDGWALVLCVCWCSFETQVDPCNVDTLWLPVAKGPFFFKHRREMCANAIGCFSGYSCIRNRLCHAVAFSSELRHLFIFVFSLCASLYLMVAWRAVGLCDTGTHTFAVADVGRQPQPITCVFFLVFSMI